MSQNLPGSSDAIDPSVEFFSVQIAATQDGRVAVGIVATICERDGELEGMDLGNHRVDSIDDALAVIRHAIKPVH